MSKYEIWDLIINGAGIFILAGSIIFGFYINNISIAEQYKTKYWETQIELYLELCDIVSTLPNYKVDSIDYTKTKEKFYQLYYGKMNIVEDAMIQSEMMSFTVDLKKFEKGDIVSSQLRGKALKLCYELRKSIKKSWKKPLEDIPSDFKK